MAQFDVIIRGTGMGHCDEVLSETLMKGYIHTLTQKAELPGHIILYGEGVKLCCTGSESIEDLKALIEKGVKVLSCGICLDFYELSDDLQVGGTTTMGEVADIVAKSACIFEP